MDDPKVKHYAHNNGRHCILGPDGIWRHWDHPSPEPGPREKVDYECRMDHYIAMTMEDSITAPHQKKSLPGLGIEYDQPDDRGEFGMPTIGTPWPFSHGDVFQVKTRDLLRERPKCETTIREDGVWYDYGEQGNHVESQTNQARRILGTILPDVMSHFIERNAEYGEESHVLGTKGQFADINRKVIKLKRYLWDGVPVPVGAEDINTIAGELVGHLLILIDELETLEIKDA